MLITDESIADSLMAVTPARMLVLASRAAYESQGARPTSKYECCACAMPARRHDEPCEMCGRKQFKPLRPVIQRPHAGGNPWA